MRGGAERICGADDGTHKKEEEKGLRSFYSESSLGDWNNVTQDTSVHYPKMRTSLVNSASESDSAVFRRVNDSEH
jgi:hypothetical protein